MLVYNNSNLFISGLFKERYLNKIFDLNEETKKIDLEKLTRHKSVYDILDISSFDTKEQYQKYQFKEGIKKLKNILLVDKVIAEGVHFSDDYSFGEFHRDSIYDAYVLFNEIEKESYRIYQEEYKMYKQIIADAQQLAYNAPESMFNIKEYHLKRLGMDVYKNQYFFDVFKNKPIYKYLGFEKLPFIYLDLNLSYLNLSYLKMPSK